MANVPNNKPEIFFPNLNSDLKIALKGEEGKQEAPWVSINCFYVPVQRSTVKTPYLQIEQRCQKIVSASRYFEDDERSVQGVIANFSSQSFTGEDYALAFAIADKMARFPPLGRWKKIYAIGGIDYDKGDHLLPVKAFEQVLDLLLSDLPSFIETETSRNVVSLFIYPKFNLKDMSLSCRDKLQLLKKAPIAFKEITQIRQLENFLWNGGGSDADLKRKKLKKRIAILSLLASFCAYLLFFPADSKRLKNTLLERLLLKESIAMNRIIARLPEAIQSSIQQMKKRSEMDEKIGGLSDSLDEQLKLSLAQYKVQNEMMAKALDEGEKIESFYSESRLKKEEIENRLNRYGDQCYDNFMVSKKEYDHAKTFQTWVSLDSLSKSEAISRFKSFIIKEKMTISKHYSSRDNSSRDNSSDDNEQTIVDMVMATESIQVSNEESKRIKYNAMFFLVGGQLNIYFSIILFSPVNSTNENIANYFCKTVKYISEGEGL